VYVCIYILVYIYMYTCIYYDIDCCLFTPLYLLYTHYIPHALCRALYHHENQLDPVFVDEMKFVWKKKQETAAAEAKYVYMGACIYMCIYIAACIYIYSLNSMCIL